MVRIVLSAASMLLLTACEAPVVPPTVASPVAPPAAAEAPRTTSAALPAARWDNQTAGREWTRLALGAIDAHGQQLLATEPRDVAAYCPRYSQASAAERAVFWVGLMSALARFESNFNPDVSFTEPDIFDRQGNRVVSRGLLQISQESANGYGCAITDARQLHDPATNLSCAVRIMNRLVARDGVVASTSAPWRGMAAYWRPFRRAERRADLQQWTAVQSYCR